MQSNGNQPEPTTSGSQPGNFLSQTRIEGIEILEGKPEAEPSDRQSAPPAPPEAEDSEPAGFDPMTGLSIPGGFTTAKRFLKRTPAQNTDETGDGDELEEPSDGNPVTPRTTARVRFLVLVLVLIGLAVVVTRWSRGSSDGTVVPFVATSPTAAPGGTESPAPPAVPNIPEDLKPKANTPSTEVNQDLQVRNQAAIKALRYANQNFLDLVGVRRNWYVEAWKQQNQKTGIPKESYLLIELARQNQWHYEVFDELRQKVMKNVLAQQKAGAPIYDVQPIQFAGDGEHQDTARPMSIDALVVVQLLIEEWINNGSLTVSDDQTGSIKVDEFNSDPAFSWLRDPERQTIVANKPASMIAQMRVIANAAWRVRSLNSEEEKVSNDYAKQRLLPSPVPAAPAPPANAKKPGSLPK